MPNQYYLRRTVGGLFVVFLVNQAFCLPFESDITKGNYFYHQGKFKEAERLYSKASLKKEIANYNLGNALYKQKKFKESERMFNKIITQTKNKRLKEKACYNQGNSQFKQGNYQSAIKSYEMAIKLDPNDKEAKYNLLLAKKMLQKLPQKQHQNKPKQEKKQQGKKEKQNIKPGKGMNKEDAERILQGISTDEKHRPTRIEGKGLGDKLDW